MNYNNRIVGSVHDVQLTATASFANILVKRESELDTPIKLGQHILLQNKIFPEKSYLCIAEEYRPDVPHNINPKEAMRQSKTFNRSIDELYKQELLFLGYRCRILGVCQTSSSGSVKYFSGVRSSPAFHALDVVIPDPQFLRSLIHSIAESSDNNGMSQINFEIGFLKYGSNPDDTEEYQIGTDRQVGVTYNVSNLLRKRTGIFGKSGSGKSNAVKTVIGMIAKEKPNAGILIVDTNGEFAMDNDQNDGFMDIFYESGQKNKVVLFSNKNFSEKVYKKYGTDSILPLKFDVFKNIKPSFEIVEANLDSGKKEPLYLTPWFAAISNEDEQSKIFSDQKNPGLVYGIYYKCLLNIGLKPVDEIHLGHDLTVGKEYLNHQATILKRSQSVENKDKFFDFSELEDGEKSEILKTKGIIQNKFDSKFLCRNVITMTEYAQWYVDTQMEEGSSLKPFSELLTNSRRLYELAKFHTKDDQTKRSSSLGDSVFESLKANKIVILDLPSVKSMKIARSLSNHICSNVLAKASFMFGEESQRTLFNRFEAIVVIEEAQNYLGKEEVSSGNSIYERLAKEGRKFHLGLIYVTQQPSAIDVSITSQTENIIAFHLSNEADCLVLNKIKDKFDLLTCKFMKEESAVGLSYIYSEPYQPFVLPCQIKRFNKDLILKR